MENPHGRRKAGWIMNKRDRVMAALQGKPVDRLPISLWRHHHREDRRPQDLAAATLALARVHDLDLIKLTPSGLYAVEDWAGASIHYPGTDHDPPFLASPAVTEAADWRRLSHLEPTAGALGRELETVRLVAAQTSYDRIPFVMTVFSPLTLAFKLAGETVIQHLREHPSDLKAGLETMAQTTICFAQAALEAGADGLFFATQLASHEWLTLREYEEFGQYYDLGVLEAVKGQSAITILHLHGQAVFFRLSEHYPVDAVSWHDQETAPSLAEARQFSDRAFVTGLDRRLLNQGSVVAIQAQVHEVFAQTEGRGVILAPSCVIPTTTPIEHLEAARIALLTL
jgi:uroporphyrinogen decarboxylase